MKLSKEQLQMIIFKAYSIDEYQLKVPLVTQTLNMSINAVKRNAVFIYQYLQMVNKVDFMYWMLQTHKPDEQKQAFLHNVFASVRDSIREGIKHILSNTYSKVNVLCLTGPPNTGKSFIANAIGYFYRTCYVCNLDQKSAFFFSQFNGSNLAVYEEPAINLDTVDDFKKLFAGQPISVGLKHENNRATIENVPFVVTRNSPSFGKGILDVNEEYILKQRCIDIHLFNSFITIEKFTPYDIMYYFMK